MKKIGIITINDYNNYGNRLQNYASQEVLKSLGFSVETIVNEISDGKDQDGLIHKSIRIIKMPFKDVVKIISMKIIRKTIKRDHARLIATKIDAFKKFTYENIQETNYIISKNNIPVDINDEYDYFVVGSDQVWNPACRFGSPIDFLTFTSKQKRIAYAPSFGASFIPNEYLENYRLWLSEMKSLSVREEAGARIIEELTGRESVVLVDPTLMLSREKWLTVSRTARNKPKKPYLLTYFIGGFSKENQKKIEKIATDNKLEIVKLADLNDKLRYSADPAEFIDYINSATLFMTDSFHGVVFSILMEKPFIVFDRIVEGPSMNSRIDTLLSTFSLQNRRSDNINNNDDVFHANYTHVAQILEFERNKALNYLKRSLNLDSEDQNLL